MVIGLTCPKCGKSGKHPGQEFVGKDIRCTGCESRFVVPAFTAPVVALTPPPVAPLAKPVSPLKMRGKALTIAVGLTMLATGLIAGSLWGSRQEREIARQPESVVVDSKPPLDHRLPEKLDFGGQLWTYVGPAWGAEFQMSSMPRVGSYPEHLLMPHVYTCENSDLRLVRCVRLPNSTDAIYESATAMQLKVGDTWLTNGLVVYTFLDGTKSIVIKHVGESIYDTGWHKNGKLSKMTAFLKQKPYGLMVGFYDNGKPEFMSFHDVEGKEISGKSFPENR
jgi:hypothetical protein